MKQTSDAIRKIAEEIEEFGRDADVYKKSVFQRFPFLVIGLSTYGVVAVLYGFEKFIDSMPFLAQNPFVIMLSGFTALIITGTLYKKLQ
jgi:hypothetical protein